MGLNYTALGSDSELPGNEESAAVLQADSDGGVVAEVGQRGLSPGLHGRRIDPLL